MGTDANDTFDALPLNASTGAPATTLNAFDVIDGGAGRDTLNIYTGAATGEGEAAVGPFNTVQQGTVRNVEVINIYNADGATFGAGAEGGINAAGFQGSQEIWQNGYATNVSGIAASQTVGFRDTEAGDTQNVVLSFTGNTANIQLDGEGNLEFTVVDVASATGDVDLTTLNISGSVDGRLELGSTAGVPELETVNLALSSNTSISVGSSSYDGDDEYDGFLNVTTIDASASTGNLDIALPGDFALSLESLTLGSGNDDVAIHIGAFDADEVSIDLGAGADELILVGTPDEDGVAISVTLGAGADVVRIRTENVVDVEDLEASLITITDFNGGEDLLDIGLPLLFATPDNAVTAALQGLEDDATLADAVSAVAASDDFTGFAFIDFGGNTYVYVDAGDDEGLDAGDMLVEFVGGVEFDSNNFGNSWLVPVT